MLDASEVLRSLLYFAACQEGCIFVCPSPLLLSDAIRFSYALTNNINVTISPAPSHQGFIMMDLDGELSLC